jgi:hypothetical protein
MHHNKVSLTGAAVGSSYVHWVNVSTGDMVCAIATVNRAWNRQSQQHIGQISHNQATAQVSGQVFGYLSMASRSANHGIWHCPYLTNKVAIGVGCLKVFSNSQHLWLSHMDAKLFYKVGDIRPGQQQHQAVHIIGDKWIQGSPMMTQHDIWSDFNGDTSNHVHHESGNQHIGLLQPQWINVVPDCGLLDTSTAAQDMLEIGDTAQKEHHGVHMGVRLTQHPIVNMTHNRNFQHVHLTKTYGNNKDNPITGMFSRIPQ